MKIIFVTSSIFPLENLSGLYPDHIVVVDEGDKTIRKHSKRLLDAEHSFWGLIERKKWFKNRFKNYRKYLKVIPEKTRDEISFGFLIAYEMGADIIIEIDDDVHPSTHFIDMHKENLFIKSGVTVNSSNKVYDTLENLNLSTKQLDFFARGCPYSNRDHLHSLNFSQKGGRCILNMGLWSHILDLDAISALAYKQISPKGISLRRPKIIIGKNTYFPLCSMNVAFFPSIIPAFYQLNTGIAGIDRFADIWSGLFIKRIADHLGHKISIGQPIASHRQRPRNLFRNLRVEALGMEINESLWKEIGTFEITGKNYRDCYLSLINELEKFSRFWKSQALYMRRWIDIWDVIT